MTFAQEHQVRTLILRLWREGEREDIVWRCSVEDLASKQRRRFSAFPELLSFLYLLTGSSSSPQMAALGAGAKESLETRNTTA